MTETDRARSALFHLDAGCDRSEWIRLGMAFKAAGGDSDTWLDWCASGANYGGEREARAVWRSLKTSGGVGPASLFKAAIDAGWSDGAPQRQIAPAACRPAPPDPDLRETLDPRRLAFWDSLPPISGVGREYLEARHCVIPPADGHLRYAEHLRHPSGYVGPGLVALVTHMAGAPMSLHRTWVNADGTKAAIKPPRLLLGGHRKAGGVIRLWPDEALTQGLAIAEGIETALSLAQAFQPAWALIDAGNLAKFPPLAGVESLTIAVDHDDAGQRAAGECADRWSLADCEANFVETSHGA
jgi:putative DNA primase/helicase